MTYKGNILTHIFLGNIMLLLFTITLFFLLSSKTIFSFHDMGPHCLPTHNKNFIAHVETEESLSFMKKTAYAQRILRAQNALQSFMGIALEENQIPNIALICDEDNKHSAIMLLSILSGLEKIGLYDAIQYYGGNSETLRLLTPWSQHPVPLEEGIKDTLKLHAINVYIICDPSTDKFSSNTSPLHNIQKYAQSNAYRFPYIDYTQLTKQSVSLHTHPIDLHAPIVIYITNIHKTNTSTKTSNAFVNNMESAVVQNMGIFKQALTIALDNQKKIINAMRPPARRACNCGSRR